MEGVYIVVDTVPGFESRNLRVTKLREIARDALPFLAIMIFLGALAMMVIAYVDAKSSTKDEDTVSSNQIPSEYEILEEGPDGITFTFCNHGNRVWVTRTANAVAIDTQPWSGC